jgi:type IV secretory pathway VirB2 component (pilin)
LTFTFSSDIRDHDHRWRRRTAFVDHGNTTIEEKTAMIRTSSDHSRARRGRRRTVYTMTLVALTLMVSARAAWAQSPWERAAMNLELSFTGPLARSLALVAIVIGGLLFMYGESGAKRQISGIVFGGGLALFAAQFLTWLF